jgi:hypothetical protein
MNTVKNNQEIYGLIEKNTYLISGLSGNLSVINAVIENSLGSYFIMPYMLHRDGSNLLDESPWLCVIDPNKGTISRHSFNIDLEQFKNLNIKIKALEKISRDLSVQKSRYKNSNNDFTDLIFITREQQAKNFISGIKDENYYIKEYADALNLSLDQAAHDIVTRSDLMHRDLARIEGMKLKYFKMILENSVDHVSDILDKFRKECWFSN